MQNYLSPFAAPSLKSGLRPCHQGLFSSLLRLRSPIRPATLQLETSMTDLVAAKSQKPFFRSVPFIVFCGCMISMITFGPRSAMGFFQIPMLTEFGWDRTTFALAMAIQNLMWGLGQPFFGALAGAGPGGHLSPSAG